MKPWSAWKTVLVIAAGVFIGMALFCGGFLLWSDTYYKAGGK